MLLHKQISTNASPEPNDLCLGQNVFWHFAELLNRLESFDMVDRLPELSKIYRSFIAEGSNYELTTKKIVEIERPPMITVPSIARNSA